MIVCFYTIHFVQIHTNQPSRKIHPKSGEIRLECPTADDSTCPLITGIISSSSCVVQTSIALLIKYSILMRNRLLFETFI